MATLVRARIVRDERVVEPAALTTRRVSARVVRREILEAREKAARIVEAAEAEAQARLESLANAERVALEVAKERGYQEGLADAAARVVASIAEQQLALSRNDARLVALARLLAERLLGHLLTTDENTVRDMALTLLREVRGARRVTLGVNAADVALLEQAVAKVAGVLEITIEARTDLARGDFRLATDVGSLEGSLGSRLDLLAKKLRESLNA